MHVFLFFAFFGVGVEIIFTAIYDFLRPPRAEKSGLTLQGHSYLWMFLVYGSIGFIFPPLYNQVVTFPLIIRALIYGVTILMMEGVVGIVLKLLTGKVPWHYTTGLRLGPYIRIDYLPLWMEFGVVVEYLYLNVFL